MIHMCL